MNISRKIWCGWAAVFLVIFISGCPMGSFGKNNLNSAGQDKTLGAPSPKPGKNQLVFRLAENQTIEYSATLGDIEFARLVEQRSRGRIKIIVYYGAKLGDEASVIQQVQFGGIDFARVNAAPLSEIYKPLSVLSLPYIFRDSNHLWNVLYGPIGDDLLQGLSAYNLTGLTYYSSAARNFYTKRPVRSVEDMKGLRIRVLQSTLYMDLVRALGAEPVPVAYGDVYNALLLGQVDGAENNWSSYYEMNHYRLAKYYTLDMHTRTPEVLMACRDVFVKLSKSDQELIMKAAKDSVKLQWDEAAAEEAKSEVTLRKYGVQVINLNDTERNKFKAAVDGLYQVYGKEYQQLIERIRNTK